jgi:hypothetical protein
MKRIVVEDIFISQAHESGICANVMLPRLENLLRTYLSSPKHCFGLFVGICHAIVVVREVRQGTVTLGKIKLNIANPFDRAGPDLRLIEDPAFMCPPT